MVSVFSEKHRLYFLENTPGELSEESRSFTRIFYIGYNETYERTTMFTLYYKHVVKTMQTIDPEYQPTKKELFKAIASDALILVGVGTAAVGVSMLINNSASEDDNN